MFFEIFLNKDVNVFNFNVIEVYRWCYIGFFSVCKYLGLSIYEGRGI